MKTILIFFLCASAFGQNILHEPGNKKLFADHLFCTGDYLRAVEEYESYLKFNYEDTVEFRILLSLYALEKYETADRKAETLYKSNLFKDLVLAEELKNLIKRNEYYRVREVYSERGSDNPVHKKLMNFSYLYTEKDSIPSPPYLTLPFTEDENKEFQNLYNRKMNLPLKDPVLAGFLSFLFPGAGKIYTEEYGDAFFAALTTGIFAYLAYDNLRAGHTFRGVLFTGITAWFYGGNIYGSAVSAQLFNAKVNFNFSLLLDEYLRVRNFFLPDYGFCR